MSRLSRCRVYLIGPLFLLCGDLIDLLHLPNSQEPHAHSRSYVHTARENLSVEISISLLLPKLKGYWLSDYVKISQALGDENCRRGETTYML